MVAVACCAVLALCGPAVAQAPLYEEEPYDQITLDKANNSAVLKVKPLDLPGRKPPEAPAPGDKLTVRLVDRPEQAYEVLWRSIEKIELFEQLVLGKANQLVAAGKLDEAYDYFQFLENKYPQLAGLGPAMEEYLYAEAKAAHRRKQYDVSLAMLRELCRRDPKRPGLDKALGVATEALVEQYLAKQDYLSARRLLRNLAGLYPEHPVVAARESQLRAQAAGLMTEAGAAADAGDWAKAAAAARRLMEVWPDLPGAKQLAQKAHKQYPRVVIGVGLPAVEMEPARLDDWAARRSTRLLYRTLTELVGPGPEGGRYQCPVGELVCQTADRRLLITLTPGAGWSAGDATLTAADVARQLLAMCDPGGRTYRPQWAELLSRVTVRGVYQLDVQLLRPHIRPDSLLQTILVPGAGPLSLRESSATGPLSLRERAGVRAAAAEAEKHPSQPHPPPGQLAEAERSAPPPLTNGPFVLDRRSQSETTYGGNAQYFALAVGQPREVVERRFPAGNKALAALRRGRVLILDRVNPWDVQSLRGDDNLVVERYAMPLVHCLIPNLRKPLAGNRTFRRALVYGIQRQAILEQMTGGVQLPGCRVISGPFPPGFTYDDPLGYACDEKLEPRPYDPRLAVALAAVSLREVAVAESKEGKEGKEGAEEKDRKEEPAKPRAEEAKGAKASKGVPRLVLAHPPDEIARVACNLIRRHLELIRIPLELKELPAPVEHVPEDADFLYAELAMWEPLVDARRLLGEDGMAGGCSPYMGLALRRLDQVTDWQQARQQLRRIHRLAHEDVAVIPLWQLADYFAHHKGVEGIGKEPVTLYQNIEQWRIPFQPAAD